MDILKAKVKEVVSAYRVTWSVYVCDVPSFHPDPIRIARKVKFFANPLRAANFKTELTKSALLLELPFAEKPTVEKVELE